MRRKGKLSRGVAVVGGGLTKLGLFKDRNCKDFFTEAFVEMAGSIDKGFDPKEIDAVYVGNYSNDFFVNQSHWGPIIADAAFNSEVQHMSPKLHWAFGN